MSDGSPTTAEVLEAVAAQQAQTERLLTELVAAPTLLGAERAGQDIMHDAFTRLGLSVVRQPLDAAAISAHPGAAPFSWEIAGKHNVIGDWEPAGDSGRSLILNGHIDVVPPGPEDLWSGPPFAPRREGDWLYGRGAGDMKAGLATYVGAVAGLRALGLAPLAAVQLQSVVEEECTGNGALQAVIGGRPADAVVVTEPTNLAIQRAQLGVLWFQVVVRGRPAHAGDAPIGANAIEASFAIVAALRALEASRNVAAPPPFDVFEHPVNLNVGELRGGDWPSTVAAEAVLRCRLALYPEETVQDLRDAVELAVAGAILAGGDFSATVRYDGFACRGYALDVAAPLIDVLGAAVEEITGERPALVASTATTDARQWALYADTPAVCFGPYNEGSHSVDERVWLPSVLRSAQALALFIVRWCGVTRG